jgi:PAS domain S-box-containing protein
MVRGIDLFFALFNNLAIFIALVAIYRSLLLQLERPRLLGGQTLFGVVFGLFAIGSMYARIPVFDGVIVDQRNAIVALSGAFGGPASAAITAFFAAGFRLYLGGGGVLAGVIGVALAASSGLAIRRLPGTFDSVRRAAASSLLATIIVLPGFLFVEDLSTGWSLMKAMALPYGIAIFVGIFFVGLLLRREEERHRVKLSLRESEEKYRVLFESFPLGIIVSDADGKTLETNRIAENLVGETVLRPDGSVMPENERPGSRALAEQRRIENVELGLPRDGGAIAWLNVTAAPIPLAGYGAAVTYNDVTDRKEAQERLEQALTERTALLQELYHRTKNNMQIIIALLDWQSDHVEDPELLDILRETQNRIRSMALVHQELYRSQDLSRINLRPYIRELTDLIFESYEISPDKIEVRESTEDVNVLIDTAVPCGLIIEEVVSNVLKHAFPDGRAGALTIELREGDDDEVLIRVADDGLGLPTGFDPRTRGGIGFQTIYALGESQLQGKVAVDGTKGVSVSLQFKDDRFDQRV